MEPFLPPHIIGEIVYLCLQQRALLDVNEKLSTYVKRIEIVMLCHRWQ